MTYTSDQQLAAMGLRRMEDAKCAGHITVVTREGKEIRALACEMGLYDMSEENVSIRQLVPLDSLIGWKRYA